MYVKEISEKFVNQYKHKIPPFGPIGLQVYKRTYARKIEGSNRTEEWHETIHRCVNGLLKIGAKLTEKDAETLFDYVFNLKCCFSGRGLWQLGTKTVDKLGGDSLINCWACTISSLESFCFLFDELMLGGGVGFNVQAEYVYELPKVRSGEINIIRRDEKDVDFIVPDNREGWVELLRRVLSSFFHTGKSFSYSTICVRGKGSPIRSFGGTASGPEDLCNGMDKIIEVLKARGDKKLRPVDCLDICNIIASIVVAGNVRRSACLALGDMNDIQFMDAKNWGKGNVPNWRAMSNNSVACSEYEHLPAKFWLGYNGDGEPYGLVNLKNCRTYGRLIDGKGYRPDKKVAVVNPCAEVPLEGSSPSGNGEGGECCNLAEIFLSNLKDEDEFKMAAELCYKVTKSISCMKFIHAGSSEILARNHRLGIGVTGFLQASHLRNEKIFNSVYKHLEKLDKEYSKIMGVPESIKMCTCKPSGTLSLLAGCTPGVHPAFAPYYIRRIRMASSDPIVAICRTHGYPVEPQKNFDGTFNRDTMIVSFPIKTPEGTICAKDLSAVQQMEWATWLQTHWSDNSVSVTVYYKKEELPEIKKWLSENYDDRVKTMSFLLHSDHGFMQAPMEEITEAQYNEMVAKVKPITKIVDDKVASLKDSLECTSGACPIK